MGQNESIRVILKQVKLKSLICIPKSEGGLGIRSLRTWNKALMTTNIWKILSRKESLWVRWVHTYRLSSRSFWDVRVHADASWGWRKPLLIRDNVRWHFLSKIGNGRQTSAWFDTWSEIGPLINWFTRREITSSSSGYEITCKISDLINMHGWSWPITWVSKFPVLNYLPTPQLQETMDDRVVWLEADGNEIDFSASVAWDSFRYRDSKVEWEKVIWFSNAILRHSILVWLLIRRGLKTQDRLKVWDRGGGAISCVFCALQPDSHDHIFFECPFPLQVWQKLGQYMSKHYACFRWPDIVSSLQASAKINNSWSIIDRLVFGAAVYFI